MIMRSWGFKRDQSNQCVAIESSSLLLPSHLLTSIFLFPRKMRNILIHWGSLSQVSSWANWTYFNIFVSKEDEKYPYSLGQS